MRCTKRSPKRSSDFSIRLMSHRSLPRPMITSGGSAQSCAVSGRIHQPAHLADRGLQADEDRLADQEVADIELAHVGDGGDRADVFVVEAVAGMALQAELLAMRGGLLDAQKLGLAL